MAIFSTLAQIQSAPVAMLPRPPLLQVYLLEQPWYMAIGLAAAGIAAFFVLNRAGKLREGLLLATGGITLGAAVLLVGLMVTTERERLMRQTSLLVDAAAGVDTAALDPMLDDPVTVWLGSNPTKMSREELLNKVRDALGGQYRVRDQRTGGLQVVLDGERQARTQVRVWVRAEAMGYDVPIGSWWRIDWRRSDTTPGAPWRVYGLTLMQVDGMSDVDNGRLRMP